MNVQFIEKDGSPEWVVIPYETFRQLVEDAEMLQDIRDYDQVQEVVRQGQELIPSEVVYAILDGQNPIKVWREYRGLTQQQVAELAGISEAQLRQIELGIEAGSTEVLSAIARALKVSLDDLV